MQGARVQPLIRALDPTYCNWVCTTTKRSSVLQLRPCRVPSRFSRVLLFVTPWPTRLLCPWDSQARTLEWVAMPPLQGIFPTQGSNLHLTSPALAGRFFTTSATWQLRTGTAKWIIKKKKKRQKYSRNKEERISKSNWEYQRRHRGERRGHVWAETQSLSDEHQANGKENTL